jgi:hypothetical protein
MQTHNIGNRLVVICGSPRTGTTHLLASLLSHKQIKGSMEDCNENPKINIKDLKNYEELNFLFKKYEVLENELLAIKAPGYCFGFDYFNSSFFDCYYIYTSRYWWEIVESMLNHKSSLDILKMDLDSTDCPDKEKYFLLWEETKLLLQNDLIKRAKARIDWHNLNEKMRLEGVEIPYISRMNPGLVYNKLLTYLDIDYDYDLLASLSTFYYRPMELDRKKELFNV